MDRGSLRCRGLKATETRSRRSSYVEVCEETLIKLVQSDKTFSHIFFCASGVLGLGEFSLSISFGTEDVVDMLSHVSSVSPVL